MSKKTNSTEGNNEFPKSFSELVGTTQKFNGFLFSRKKPVKNEKYQVLDIRWSDAIIMNNETKVLKRLAVELLLKNNTMKRAQWSRPFMYGEND